MVRHEHVDIQPRPPVFCWAPFPLFWQAADSCNPFAENDVAADVVEAKSKAGVSRQPGSTPLASWKVPQQTEDGDVSLPKEFSTHSVSSSQAPPN